MWKQAVAFRGEERVPDEYDEFSDYDLPSYVGSSSSFHKLPWCPDDASLARSKAEVAIVGAPPVVPSRPERAHRVIREKVRRVARTGAIPIVLGGDHSITFPSASAVSEVRRPKRLGMVHFDAHAGTAPDLWGALRSHGTPMRRLIEEGWIDGRNCVQVGLRGYWPDEATFAWMREKGLRWHTMVEIEDRGVAAVVDDGIPGALRRG